MRTALSAICVFTILASCWLFTMFLVLRHPGFGWRASLAIGFIAVSVVTLGAARAATAPGAALRAIVAAGAVLLAGVGCWAIATNVDDGFVDVIGVALIVQSALALAFVLRSAVRRLS